MIKDQIGRIMTLILFILTTFCKKWTKCYSILFNKQHANDARLELPEDAGKSLCQRRKLSVDFNEIGWGEWIISPKTFDAQYCTGRCPFPLTKVIRVILILTSTITHS